MVRAAPTSGPFAVPRVYRNLEIFLGQSRVASRWRATNWAALKRLREFAATLHSVRVSRHVAFDLSDVLAQRLPGFGYCFQDDLVVDVVVFMDEPIP